MERDKTQRLILRARNGDGDAFVELMEQRKQSMYKTAKAWLGREEDVADAISETILDCFEHLDTLKEPRLRQGQSVRKELCGAGECCGLLWRRRWRRPWCCSAVWECWQRYGILT